MKRKFYEEMNIDPENPIEVVGYKNLCDCLLFVFSKIVKESEVSGNSLDMVFLMIYITC